MKCSCFETLSTFLANQKTMFHALNAGHQAFFRLFLRVCLGSYALTSKGASVGDVWGRTGWVARCRSGGDLPASHATGPLDLLDCWTAGALDCWTAVPLGTWAPAAVAASVSAVKARRKNPAAVQTQQRMAPFPLAARCKDWKRGLSCREPRHNTMSICTYQSTRSNARASERRAEAQSYLLRDTEHGGDPGASPIARQ